MGRRVRFLLWDSRAVQGVVQKVGGELSIVLISSIFISQFRARPYSTVLFGTRVS